MTQTAAPAPATAETTAEIDMNSNPHRRGVHLLDRYLDALPTLGYRKAAVDTWRNDYLGHNIRHSYVGGEWTLTVWFTHSTASQVKWSVRAQMPTVEQLLTDTMPPQA
jgi:hypothetical protein